MFDACLEILDGGSDAAVGHGNGPPDAEREAAQTFLAAIGYLPGAGDAAASGEEAATREHRRRLLTLAGRLSRLLDLPLFRSPGVHFLGGQAEPGRFGIAGFEEAPLNVAGRGLTRRQAFESCIGEAAEHLSFLEWPGDAGRGAAEMHPHCPDPDWALAGLGPGGDAAGQPPDWIAAEPLAGGRLGWFPLELCLRRPPRKRRAPWPAESNGCSAAPTREAATAAGLAELIERDAVALWWYGGAAAGRLREGWLRETGIDARLQAIRPDAARRTWFLSLPSACGIPVVAALSSEPDGSAVVGGFAADPDAVRAALRALLEMCQMELAQDLAVLRARGRGEAVLGEQERIWVERRNRLSVAGYPRLQPAEAASPGPSAGHGGTAADILCDALHRHRFAAYRIDLTRAAIGIPVVRMLVPGLQSARPAWTSRRLKAAAHVHSVDLGRRMREISPI